MQVSRWLSNITFHVLQIWLQTFVDSASCQTLFPSFHTVPSEVAVLFDQDLSRLSRCPFLEQAVDIEMLLCTGFDLEHAICSYAAMPFF